jgi:hypothetical protein
MSWDFTLDRYRELCQAIKTSFDQVVTVAQFIKAGQPFSSVLVLRHDVDRSLSKALAMAELEASLSLSSTYYIRMNRFVFRPEKVSHLLRLGHEVGYHYEVLTRARGRHEVAITRFGEELGRMRQVVPVETASKHGSPLLPWDNIDLWRHYDYREYGLIGEVYLSVNYDRVFYFTDTGRSWDADRHNIRDHVGGRKPDKRISTTDDLIAFLRRPCGSPVLLNVHPNRWSASPWDWGTTLAYDWSCNIMKEIISKVLRPSWRNATRRSTGGD